MKTPLITAIVSTYNSERFMRGCLDDLVRQTIFPETEILIIDSGSAQAEAEVCAPYLRNHPNIRFLRTERESLYVTWNRAIQMAKGKYLTSANTDDRHRSDAFECLAGELERSPDIALAYADQFISHTENETYESCEARSAKQACLPEFTPENLMRRCITGSQPMWRREKHARHGIFDTTYRIAADYDMWMRFAEAAWFRRLPETLGVVFDSPTTLSGSNNRWPLDMENLKIQTTHLEKVPWAQNKDLRLEMSKKMFLTGYWYVEHAMDLHQARPFLKAAWKLDPLNLNFAKTYLLRGILGTTMRLEQP